MASSALRAVTLFCGASLTAAVCPPADFSTAQNFDLNSYVAGRWYIQEQMPTNYLPESQNYCVYAEYTLGYHLLGYEVTVHNHAEDVADPHAAHDSGNTLCAKVVDEASGKVGGRALFPSSVFGPYWVVDYDESAGYALISGGAPTHETAGGCSTGTGTNNAGFWIFTRQQTRTQTLYEGFDLSVLNVVQQPAGCDATAGSHGSPPSLRQMG